MLNSYLAVAALVLMTGCASAQNTATAAENGSEAAAVEAEAAAEAGQTGAEAAEDTSIAGTQTEAAETIEMVTIVIPTVYESVTTQEEADAIRKKNGYESAVLNEDGSLTVVMSVEQHEEMLDQFRKSVDQGISEIINADGDSAIEKIEYNEEYSVFTVTVSGDELGIVDRQAADELVMYGTLYHIYSGNAADHIQVDYVSSESGEIIETADSGSLEKAY